MGTWGVAIFSNDTAADVRDGFRDLVGEGLSSSVAVDRMLKEDPSLLDDRRDAAVFWLALAAIQWKLGRLEERTKIKALAIIDSGADLMHWDIPKYREDRKKVLGKLRAQLQSPQPPMKRVPRRIKSATEWSLGEVVALRLKSGRWTLIRVTGYHADKGGRSSVCELLNWIGDEIPPGDAINQLAVRGGKGMEFLFQEPRKKMDKARVKRLGIISTPSQKCGGYTVLLWRFVDRDLKGMYGID